MDGDLPSEGEEARGESVKEGDDWRREAGGGERRAEERGGCRGESRLM